MSLIGTLTAAAAAVNGDPESEAWMETRGRNQNKDGRERGELVNTESESKLLGFWLSVTILCVSLFISKTGMITPMIPDSRVSSLVSPLLLFRSIS